MPYTVVKKLPTSDEIIAKNPLSEKGRLSVEQHKQEIKNILSGKDDRLLVVVGPCSAWPYDAVLEYAQELAKINELVKDKLKLVMRVYIQKPRTVKGWTGPINQPNPKLPPDIEAGILYCRSLMVKVIEMGLAIADEALFTHNARGFLELLSWVAIGARSSEDQEHRIFASAIDCPVGMKNPTHGSLKIAINSVIAAQNKHTAVFDGYEVQTHGNPYAHLVLRGSNEMPNYSIKHLEEIKALFDQTDLNNKSVVIDVSHDNCKINGKKDHNAQAAIILEVMKNLKSHPDLKKIVKGFMLESFIKPGSQNIDLVDEIDLSGLSITDPCLGIEATKSLLLDLARFG